MSNLSRRTVLRGALAALALPLLPSLGHGAEPPARQQQRPPRRFLALTLGDGLHPQGWWAKGTGKAMQLGETLAPFAALADQLCLVTGLSHAREMGRVHGYHFTTLLSCSYAPVGKIEAATSLDQHLARHIGGEAPIPSLVLGVEAVRPGIVNGAPSVYQATCSWSSPTTPVTPEILPRQAYDRLFDVSGLAADRSVLDHVLDQAKSVLGRVSREDRHKLGEFYDSVREIEVRIARSVEGRPKDAWQPTLAKPDLERPQPGVPADKHEHVRLMLDLVVLALRMDKTRVANVVLQQDFSSRTYEFLPGVSRTGSHTLSHHNADTLREYQLVNRYHAEQAAYVCQRLAAIDEGGSTLLDNTLVLFASCFADGNPHDRTKLPMLLVGGTAHGLNRGRVVAAPGDPAKGEHPLGDLHLAIARSFGLSLDRFGNGSSPLPGVFAA